MNTENIIRMAREASGGMLSYDAEGNWRLNETEVAHFAALVAAAEREACAVIAETPVSGEQDDITMQAKDRVAAAIRARGKHE